MNNPFVYQGAIERNIYGWMDACGSTKFEVKLKRNGEQVFSGFFLTFEEARQALMSAAALFPLKQGGSICTHGRQRSKCKDCGGSSICTHGRVRSTCKDCGGGS